MDKSMKFDVIVAGGGPSGSYSAFHLAKSGFKVLVLEKSPKGRYKACAGGISQKILSLLPSVPSEIIERNIYGSRVYSPSGKVLSRFSSKPIGYTVYRTKFDLWLMNLAEKEGALIKDRTFVERILISQTGVKVQSKENSGHKEFYGELLIGAFGIQPNLHRQLRMRPPKCVKSAQIELAMNKETIDETIGNLFEYYYNSKYTDLGYVWLFPKREGVTIGFADKIDSKNIIGRLQNLIENDPIIKEKIKESKPLPIGGRSIYVHLIPNGPLNKTYGRRFLLVGDSAGFVNPFTGEGISFALSSGKIAAKVCEDALEKNDFTEEYLKEYQRRWKRSFDKDFKRGLRLQKILYGEGYDAKWESLIEFLMKIDVRTSPRSWNFQV